MSVFWCDLPDHPSQRFTHLCSGVGTVWIVTTRQIKVFFLDLKVEGTFPGSKAGACPADTAQIFRGVQGSPSRPQLFSPPVPVMRTQRTLRSPQRSSSPVLSSCRGTKQLLSRFDAHFPSPLSLASEHRASFTTGVNPFTGCVLWVEVFGNGKTHLLERGSGASLRQQVAAADNERAEGSGRSWASTADLTLTGSGLVVVGGFRHPSAEAEVW